MSSASEVADLIQFGHNILSIKSYATSLTALWAYDYLLTLDDEIRYAWKMENSLMFVLFLLIRYTPVPFLIWATASSWSFSYTPEGINHSYGQMCKKTGFIELMYFTFIAAFAQIILTQRTYAITRKSKWVAAVLYTIATIQFGVGFYTVIRAVENPAVLSTVPLDSYHLCLPHVETVWTIVQVSLSLGFDIGVLVLVIVQVQIIKSRNRGMKVSGVLTRVTRDAEIYFAVISSSHLLVIIMYSTTKPILRVVAVMGSSTFIPMMITRMLLSLKKVVHRPQPHLSLKVPSGPPMHIQDCYSPRQVDGIRLSVFRDEQH